MNCKDCGKVLEQVEGKRSKEYCNDVCRMRFQRKNKDSSILAQKQGLENAPESSVLSANPNINTEHTLKSEHQLVNTEQAISEQKSNPNNIGQDAELVQCVQIVDDKIIPDCPPVESIGNVAISPEGVNKFVEPVDPQKLIPNFGQPDCQCKHCQSVRSGNLKLTVNHGEFIPNAFSFGIVNRVSLPCDIDYSGVIRC
jgi:hypothetical protein